MTLERIGSQGCLALIGGGEFSFGETLLADRAWLEDLTPGPIGFLPTASGSTDYGTHFEQYLAETFDREVRTIPIYRSRDARRTKNLERLEECVAVYIGGGVADQLIETLADSPALETLARLLGEGRTIIAIAAAAQALGAVARSLRGSNDLVGLGWLTSGVVEPNFDPGHDRRLRQMMSVTGVRWGLGLPAGSALLMGPSNQNKFVGTTFVLQDADGDFEIFGQE
ncbi:MAG: Type 1 glutamine amidotransferase-like domain-containing protein [Acidobacteriota bacterium]